MVGVDPEEVFTDARGCKVLNGAAAVKKVKKVGGVEKHMQRFISNFIPINACWTHLKGGDQHLPYLGQLTLLEQEDNQVRFIELAITFFGFLSVGIAICALRKPLTQRSSLALQGS